MESAQLQSPLVLEVRLGGRRGSERDAPGGVRRVRQPAAAANGRRQPRPSRAELRRRRRPARRAGTAKPIQLTAWFTDRRSINDMTEKEAIPEFESQEPGHQGRAPVRARGPDPAEAAGRQGGQQRPERDRDRRDLRGHALEEQGAAADPRAVMNVRDEMGAKVGDLYKLPPGPGAGRVLRPAQRHLRRRPLLQRGAAGRAQVKPGADPHQVGRLHQVGQGRHLVEGQHARADRLRDLRHRGQPAPRVPRPDGRLAGRQHVRDQGQGRAGARPRVRQPSSGCSTSTTSTSSTPATA